MLSRLQLQVAEIVAGLDEAADFALAGGGALIVRGDVHRQTRDLDFFGLTTAAVDRLLPAVERALASAGLGVQRIQVGVGFARLAIESEDDRTEIDLAADARLFPAEPGRPAPLLSREELAVDKVLAVFGRAEARGFADLMALEERFGLERSAGSRPRRIAGLSRRCSPECSPGSTGSDETSSILTMPGTKN